MPIPTPSAGQSESDFMQECISFLRSEGKPQDQAVAICARQWAGKSMLPVARDERQKELYWKTFDRKRWQFTDWAQGKVSDALNTQARQVLKALEEEGLSQALQDVEFTVQEKPIRDALEDIYARVGGYYAQDVFNGFKSGYRVMQTKDEVTFAEFIRQWFQIEGAARVTQITLTTRKYMRQILEEGISDGSSIDEIARKLRDNFRTIGLQRARMIARTEIIGASNRGSLEGAKRTGLNLRKEWLSTRDGRTRTFADGDQADHRLPDGQKVRIDQPFSVPTETGTENLMYPGDVNGSAANVIACRCTMVYEPIE